MSLPSKLVFVDIETTGSRVTYDRIIEIGILRMEYGELVDTYQTLLNPELYLSPFIENLTGISKNELEQAPTFNDVKDVILEKLSDCIFVAHNVKFDYGFLRNEFQRHNLLYSSKYFCTAKLSRLLFPHHRRHNLDAIIERFGFTCTNRHRAFDDARVLWDFYQTIQKEYNADTLSKTFSILLKKPSLPAGISEDDINNLPDSPGVYIFYDAQNTPLYVGKSINIKERVLSHFTSDHTSTKEMSLCSQVERIETLTTSCELGALLNESYLIINQITEIETSIKELLKEK